MFDQVQTFALTSLQAIRVERKCFFFLFFPARFPSVVSLYATRISCCGIEVSWLASSRCQVVTEWNSYVIRVFAAQRDWKQPKMVTLSLASSDSAARGHLGTKRSTISGFLKKKGRNFLVLTHARYQLFKEFVVHKERCKVTPGPPLQLKILSFTYN